ncbi:MAG: iron-containing alcohol dehydrogenase [Spirochaetaceae bacterium]|nr:iron-containing alcohol dehydrogenase [Spirochaetaceae bacterium]
MAEFNINIKSDFLSGRGKIEKLPGFLKKDCRRVVVVRDPNTPDDIASDISALLLKKGVDCVFYGDISSKSTSKDAETLVNFIRKGFVQCVIGYGGQKVVNIARISAFAAGNGLDIDDILDGSADLSGISLKNSKESIDYIEIPSSIRNPLMFTPLIYVTDSRRRAVRIIDIKFQPSIIIKDSSIFDKLQKVSVDSISFELLSIMLEILISKDKHYFTNTLVAAPFVKLFKAIYNGDWISTDDYSDIALCSDYAYSILGPGISYYIALVLNSMFGVPVSILSTILLPHVIEHYATFSPETVKNVIGKIYNDQAIDAEDFVTMVRKMIKKKNLPIRLSEVDIKKNKLNNVLSSASQYPDIIKNNCNMEEGKIISILHNAL